MPDNGTDTAVYCPTCEKIVYITSGSAGAPCPICEAITQEIEN